VRTAAETVKPDKSDNRAKLPDGAIPKIACSQKGFSLVAMEMPASVRIDKWLWAVRLYKSRSLAIDACNAGHVKIDGLSVKPSREVHTGEVISAFTAGRVHRTVKVLALLDQRVGAKLVSQYLEDLTAPEEYTRAREEAWQSTVHFPKGFGRPTKKQRRQMEKLF
jgi:ribosome-associated heat shock protein Hsp15